MNRLVSWRGSSWKRNTAAYLPSRSSTHSIPAAAGGNANTAAPPALLSCERPVISTSRPSTTPRNPSPGFSLIRATEASSTFSVFAVSRMLDASGCFEYCSRLAANRSASFRLTSGAVSVSVNEGLPYVSVPVLSKISVRHESIRSSIAGFRITMPRRAASEIAPMIATGIPISSGHGVAITSTARNRVGSPLMAHPTPATARAAGVYQLPSRSAIRCIRGRFSPASCITAMIFAYRESGTSLVAVIVSALSPLIAPDRTGAPGILEIRNGSPVR